jgi:anti-sigma regulatory factor (Ser/Thr protein kinase)
MNSLETRTVQLTIHNELSEVAQLRDAVDRLAEELKVPTRSLIQLQVALDEVVSNVIQYAWPSGGTHEFLVRVTLGPTAAKVEVVDDGMSFDPRQAPDPREAPEGRQPAVGGRGISMLKNLVDSIDYARVDGCNHTTLKKNW